MCGVTLIVCKKGNNKNESKLLSVSDHFVEDQKKRGPDFVDRLFFDVLDYEVCVMSSVLWIRGSKMQKQPVLLKNGDVFAWNGEMYNVSKEENECSDTLVLAKRLESATDIAECIANVEGPFAMVYFSKKENAFYFARNEYGQRSLLLSTPIALSGEKISHEADHSIGQGAVKLEKEGDMIVVSSVVPQSLQNLRWCEISVTGVYKMNVKPGDCLEVELARNYGAYKKRISSPPTIDLELKRVDCQRQIFDLLCRSVEKRVSSLGDLKSVRLLFSGGVDSLLLAVLMHKYARQDCEISLRNVSFGEGESFDRKQALLALQELKRLFPERNWKLNCVDVSKEQVAETMGKVGHITFPQNTVMDITIGTVLWFAFGGSEDHCKVVFTGIGADELFGGYKRHVSKFKQKEGWSVLENELILEICRIAYRNNGRDDRLCGTFGKEGRHPFLDHDLCQFAMTCPLDLFMDLSLTEREGGKLVLRNILKDMGFCKDIWNAPKKAMQFGSQMNKVFKKFYDGKKTTGKMNMSDLLK